MIHLADMMLNRPYPDSGELLFNDMYPLLMEGKRIDIDLSGVVSLPSMFLNASIGRASKEFGTDKVKHCIVFYHITKSQADRLREYFDRI